MAAFFGGINPAISSYSSVYHQEIQKDDFENVRTALCRHLESGDYAIALDLARKWRDLALEKGRHHESEDFSLTAAQLERCLVHWGFSHLLFDENFRPRVKLVKLLELVGMEPLTEEEHQIVKINEWAQKNLLRQGERWEAQSKKFDALESAILPLIIDLGFVSGTSAHFKSYQGGLVYGALLPTVRQRLHFLIEQWKEGVRFSHLYFLGSERPVVEQYENPTSFTKDEESLLKIKKGWQAPLEFPKTENEINQLVWEQSEIPEEMQKSVKVHFMTAPMKIDPKTGKTLRPTTDDTIDSWLNASPVPGCYVVASNAPYINRQDLVIRAIAPAAYCFDTIGPEASCQVKVAVLLDELARFIFLTHQRYQKQTLNQQPRL